ncbi:MAG: hypothetical protein WHU94_07120 [Thermogemmata sp.]|jgi:hypothetical protein|uniref:AtuA-like ferredoxin-fold domain-containing protein n=1 Tax=Thermogemmata fonticola TaxID=2755323 RepID=A0A7V8VG79_9BACT|nr:hypothetical protein [Thermogemmata fonticola]MBA2227335.1 hypothetical protein [Thermogemmata fonticola]MCX8139960.1 hypothetical protein [Gemmataceae bacterium]
MTAPVTPADRPQVPRHSIHLADLAHARSGDKGNHANIAVLAYTEEGYAFLREFLTAERVAQFFASLQPSKVERYEAPNVRGLNFVLYDVLDGGASRSLRSDSQGKALAVALLQMPLTLPSHVDLERCRRQNRANS